MLNTRTKAALAAGLTGPLITGCGEGVLPRSNAAREGS